MQIGIDVIEIDRISTALKKWGPKFKELVFSPDEIAYCEVRANSNQHFAVRWAAKEAVAKALLTEHEVFMHWRDVEVLSEKNGAPKIRLHGEAAKMFNRDDLRVSLSHSRNTAAAVALLMKQK